MSKEDDEFVLHGPELTEHLWDVSLGKYLHEILSHCEYDRTFLIDAHTNEKLSYGKLLEDATVLAELFMEYGYGKNSIFSISSENNLQFYVPVVASFFIGSILAPLNHNYTIHELRHALNISKPTMILCSENAAPKFLKLQRELEFIKKVIIIDTNANIPGTSNLSTLLLEKKRRGTLRNLKPLEGKPDELKCFIMCSSGTTGLPKGVLLSQKNIMTSLLISRDARYSNLSGNDTLLGIMPFFHAFGLNTGLIAMVGGYKVVLLKQFQDDLFLKTIQDYKINILMVAPPLAIFLAKSPKLNRYDLSCVKRIGSGGAPLKKSIENELTRRLNLDCIKQAYGMTESTLSITLFRYDDYKEGSSGQLAPGISCKIRDPETGKSLGPNKVGEICIKGPQVMLGYYNNPIATKETFTLDGWLKTGDLAYYDNKGYFFIVDRLKELIKYKGFQVAPAELEAILLNHPKVLDVGVVGVPDEECGELPLAFIATYPGVVATEKEIHEFVNDKVSSQKRLRGGIRFIPEIPKNPSGKILRKELRKLLKQQKSHL